MSARVLAIGLDAAEATLIEAWATDGTLPNLARLIGASRTFTLGNSMNTLPGAIWCDITTGISVASLGIYYHPEQIRGGAVPIEIDGRSIEPTLNYWSVASAAGRRVCVVDQVQCAPNPELNGTQIVEYGLHDRICDAMPEREASWGELARRHGPYLVHACNDYPPDEAGCDALLADLKLGMARKAGIAEELIGREDWDLYTIVLGESHCVGHHFWRHHDVSSVWHDPGAPLRHRTAIRDIYRDLDALVGRLVEAAGQGATVLLYASHGMGQSRAGYQLLPEIIARLGLSSAGERGPTRGFARAAKDWLGRKLPANLLALLVGLARTKVLHGIQARVGALQYPLESAATRAAALHNNQCGAIRINLAGRDPNGCVAPGADYEATVALLRSALLELRDPGSGEPVIERVDRIDELFGPEHHPDLPDLVIRFAPGNGPIETVESARVGRIHRPYQTQGEHRSGDHTGHSRLWLSGLGFEPGPSALSAHVLDLAPTILELLDVPIPSEYDGTSLLRREA